MKRILKYALLTSFLATSTAHAAYITGITATTSMGSVSTANISHITDGSGLSALSLSATHATATMANVWVGNGTSGTVTFDLHGAYVLTDLALWNLNGDNTFGVKNVQISTSMDGSVFSALVGGPTQFATAPFAAPETAQLFSLGPLTAAYVRFNISSNWGAPSWTGLSEVGFDGTPAASGIPEPTSLALFGIGAVAFATRRQAPKAR